MFGAEGVILNLIMAASGAKTEHFLGCLGRSSTNSTDLVTQALEKGIRTKVFPCESRLDPRLVFRLANFIRQSKIQILHCHEYKSNFYGLLAGRLADVKVVSTCHGWIGRTRALRFYKAVDLKFLKRMNLVIPVSRPIQEELLKAGIRRRRILLVENGVDTNRFTPGQEIKLRQSLGIGKKTLVVGSVGRLSQEKGHRILLEAFKKLQSERDNIRLVIIGDGPLRQELEQMSSDLGLSNAVVFTGQVNDAASYYRVFDIFVLPSFTEGLPLALLEAMSTAKPVVASSVGGIPAIFSKAPIGRLVTPGNPDHLAAALSELISDHPEREKCGIQARHLAFSEYSLRSQAEKYTSAYKQVMG
jgi:glycosyltransferase involved in cell wall biosynthesis